MVGEQDDSRSRREHRLTLLLLGAVVAGALTTLAPCVLPMLPVIVGGSLNTPGAQARRHALIVTASLGVSVIVFTLILKASTALIEIPATFWQWISGVLLIGLGLVAVFPHLWERLSTRLSLQSRSTQGLTSAYTRGGSTGAILTGAALGPVFTSCSPLYGYVVVTVLPASFGLGLAMLLAYTIGLCGTLFAVALFGQRVIGRARWAINPESRFRRGLGVAFILVGVAIIAAWDKDLQTWVIENSPFRPWELDANFIPKE